VFDGLVAGRALRSAEQWNEVPTVQRDRIKALLAQGTAGQRVTVCGWVRTKRESKDVAFLAVNDGSA
jgi:hypothetical protein